uniref:Uncharacterized protein n=3 Tax=Meloidogyne TaxID=189290 RepID=A0A6V7UTA8_MELEN|nr:unnamed protein product [Meloidogyne enterolobii]CAD2166484.1 unnamed protein product [Meloidogyne enterolobii]
MVDKGEGYSAYQDLKDNSFYHGYQPLKPRKTPKFSAEFGLGSGMLNIAVARDIDAIPTGDKEDASQYQYISAHKVKKDEPVVNPMFAKPGEN